MPTPAEWRLVTGQVPEMPMDDGRGPATTLPNFERGGLWTPGSSYWEMGY
jgi:hypothetical protein